MIGLYHFCMEYYKNKMVYLNIILIIKKKKGGKRFPYMPPSNRFPAIVHNQPFSVAPQRCTLSSDCVAKLAFYLEFTKYFLNYFCPADNKAEDKAQKRHNDTQKPIIFVFYNLFVLFFLILANLRFVLLFSRFR